MIEKAETQIDGLLVKCMDEFLLELLWFKVMFGKF